MIVKGKVTSGFGVGRKFLSIPVYRQLFKRLLNREPFPGTLNIELMSGLSINEIISECKPTMIQDIEFKGRVYGGFYYWYGRIMHRGSNIDVLVIRPFRSKHKDTIIEVISSIELRRKLSLKNGDAVTIQLRCEVGKNGV